MKKTSYATHLKKVSLTVGDSSKVQTMIKDIKPGKFCVCQYGNDWYFCVVNYVSSEHGDVNMKFLHSKGASENSILCFLNSIITCNAFLKRNSPVLYSHNNFLKDKDLFFQKIKNLNKIFFGH